MHTHKSTLTNLASSLALAVMTAWPLGIASAADSTAADKSRFSDQPAPLQLEGFPERPAPLLELGDHFLGPGNLRDPIKLPTGAVWHPSLQVYGTYRSAVQIFDNGIRSQRVSEWANRLDLFGNLQLAATERVVIGFRPLDHDGLFTGYTFEPKSRRGWDDDFTYKNGQPRTLFFEGEFGELFPGLDNYDRRALDIGISVGRQPLLLQGGLLVNDDAIDMVALTKNSILPPGASTMRLSGIFAWNLIDRNDNIEDKRASLVGLDGSIDFFKSIIDFDAIYVASDRGDGVYGGIGANQRFGKLNTIFRVEQSAALDKESPRVGTGTLLFSELSFTVPYADDLVYANAFWGIDQFSSAVRGPTAGGPLGRAGILFAAVGLGHYGSPLNNRGQNSTGGAIGYQMFFGELHRRQLIFEAGTWQPTDERRNSAEALGVRFQQAFGRRTVLVLDAFGALREQGHDSFGGRVELLVKF